MSTFIPTTAPLIWPQDNSDYLDFVRAKAVCAEQLGFECSDADVNPILMPHQRACVVRSVQDGRELLAEAFGLGKSVQQLEIARIILSKLGWPGRAVIVHPLGVRQEFRRDAAMLGTEIRFVQRSEEVPSFEAGGAGIFHTNYESIRDGRLDPRMFDVILLDEGDVLRSFGSETFGEFLFGPVMQVPYRYAATATPSPNDYLELIAYAHFLGVMDMGEAKTRFFKRNSEKADSLTLHPHKEEEFWLWVASWAIFLQTPSDLGSEYSDAGYDLPPLRVIYHEVKVDHQSGDTAGALVQKNGQGKLYRDATLGVSDAAREKRLTLDLRIAEMQAVLAAGAPGDHWLIWHDLEPERKAIERALPDVVTIYGNQRAMSLEERERRIIDFSEGRTRLFAAKPIIAGSGCNFQYHCHKAVFLGIGYKFKDFLQAIKRIHRYLQSAGEVEIHIIYAESEREVLRVLLEKWEKHKILVAKLTEIIRRYGLSRAWTSDQLTRALGVTRQEASGERFRVIHNDSVIETRAMESDSKHLILTSIPFSTQYEYSPNYCDMGHTDSAEHFWRQMDFLTPQLLRVLKPGRVAVIHVKDRVVPGALTGLGFQTISPFHAECVLHYQKHGFAFLGMCTIATDVVRENNGSYRLSWTQKCIDATRIGFGMSEFLLAFRKPPTDSGNGYADEPVEKSKEDYSLGRWQIDAHGVWMSNGNRFPAPRELAHMPYSQVYRTWKAVAQDCPYDFARHVELADELEVLGKLPRDFMLVPPHAKPEATSVWSDVTRMRTLNSAQAARHQENHICPLQIDICDRAIELYSGPGEIVYDPFGGIGTVVARSVKLGRIGESCELSRPYWSDSCGHAARAEEGLTEPTLFDFAGQEVDTDVPLDDTEALIGAAD